MKRRSAALVTLISLVVFTSQVWAQGLPTAKPEQVGLSSERLERVSRALRSARLTRSSRSDDNPTCSGFAVGRPWAPTWVTKTTRLISVTSAI